MKKSILFSIFLLSGLIYYSILPNDFNPNWNKVDESYNRLEAVYLNIKCSDSLNCIIFASYDGAGGFFFRRTTDGGVTWKDVSKTKDTLIILMIIMKFQEFGI